MELESWLKDKEHWLRVQSTWVRFPAPITICTLVPELKTKTKINNKNKIPNSETMTRVLPGQTGPRIAMSIKAVCEGLPRPNRFHLLPARDTQRLLMGMHFSWGTQAVGKRNSTEKPRSNSKRVGDGVAA